jgi:hypothetical protein
MRGRFITIVALAVCAVASTAAQERATVTLNNGQRYDGVLVYPRSDQNIVDMRLHLASAGELSFPLGDVAVIDFVGGTPPANEVRTLPSGGVMVMRNGSMVRGHLHNIIRGGVVQWVDEAGHRSSYDGAQVRRLYLNADHARSAYLGPGQNTVGTVGSIDASTIRVEGHQVWVDTGIDVRRGDRMQFNATGQVQYAPGVSVNADGRRGATSGNYPVPAMGAGGLIARIGEGAAFSVGAGSRQITMSGDGRLHLGINDDHVNDNSGFFTVSVKRGGRSGFFR